MNMARRDSSRSICEEVSNCEIPIWQNLADIIFYYCFPNMLSLSRFTGLYPVLQLSE